MADVNYIISVTGNASQKLRGISGAAERTNQRVGRLRGGIRKLTSSFSSLQAGAAVLGIGFGFQATVGEAGKLDDALATVRKTTGATADEADRLFASLKQVNSRTSDLDRLAIAAEGGRLGVAVDELDSYTTAVDKAAVALGDDFSGGAKEVSSVLGKLKTLYKDTSDLQFGDALNRIGSAFNSLGNAGANNAPNVAEFTTRVATLNMTVAQSAGIGAALEELGVNAQIGAGGLRAIFKSAAEGSQKFASVLGMTEAATKKLVNTNPNEFLLRLAESLRGASSTELASTLKGLNITSQESQQVMQLLSGDINLVRTRQQQASQAFAEGTSLQQEFNLMNNTLGAALDKMANTARRAGAALGTVLAPAVMGAATVMEMMVGTGAGMIEFLRNLAVALSITGAAFLAFRTVQTINTLAWALQTFGVRTLALAMRQSLLQGLMLVRGGFTALNATMRANPIGFVITLVTLLTAAITYAWRNSEKFRSIVLGVWETVKFAFYNISKLAMDTFEGLSKLLKGAFTLDGDLLQSGLDKLTNTYGDFGEKAKKKFTEGFEKGGAKPKAKVDQTKPNPDSFFDQSQSANSPAGDTAQQTQAGLQQVSGGGSRPTTINIDLGSLIQGGITLNTTNVQEGIGEIREIVERELLRAVNGANQVANG